MAPLQGGEGRGGGQERQPSSVSAARAGEGAEPQQAAGAARLQATPSAHRVAERPVTVGDGGVHGLQRTGWRAGRAGGARMPASTARASLLTCGARRSSTSAVLRYRVCRRAARALVGARQHCTPGPLPLPLPAKDSHTPLASHLGRSEGARGKAGIQRRPEVSLLQAPHGHKVGYQLAYGTSGTCHGARGIGGGWGGGLAGRTNLLGSQRQRSCILPWTCRSYTTPRRLPPCFPPPPHALWRAPPTPAVPRIQ